MYDTGCRCRRLTDGAWTEDAVSLAEECRLTVFVDRAPFSVLFCSPSEPEELILGNLRTQGAITCAKQVRSLTLDEKGLPDALSAFVTLEKAPASVSAPTEKAAWTAEQLEALYVHVVQNAPATRGGHSTHSCTLMQDGEILCTREDIGRHNAIDRAVGWAMLHGVELCRCVAFFSGRISTEAVRKTAAAGLTVLCAKALPTAQAVRLAQASGVTLLHFSKSRGILQF